MNLLFKRKVEESELLTLENIDKYVLNKTHNLVLKLILFYKLKPYEIRMLKVRDIDFFNKRLKLESTSLQITNDNFLEELKTYISFKAESSYLFDGKFRGEPMSRDAIHKMCGYSIKQIASKINCPLSRNYSPLVLRETRVQDIYCIHNEEFLTPSRLEALRRINNLLSKQRNVIILGEAGVGKSFLIKLINSKEKLLFIDDFYEFKTTIINWVLSIFDNDKKLAEEKLNELSETSNVKYLQRTSIPNLLRIINENTKKGDYIIIIDSMDSITPRMLKCLDILKDKFRIVAASRALPKKKETLLWDFDVVELSNMNKKESYNFIEKRLPPVGIAGFKDIKEVQSHIYLNSDGNPRLMTEFIRRLENEGNVCPENLDEVMHKYGKKEKSFLVYLGIIVILLIPLRYIYLITENPNHKIIGSLALVIMIMGRYLYKNFKA